MNGNAPGCPHKMRGILIVLMGQSACGKGHTANAIKEQLLGSGVQAGVIRHLQRDVYIVETGPLLIYFCSTRKASIMTTMFVCCMIYDRSKVAWQGSS